MDTTDYRCFPDSDLLPVLISKEFIADLKKEMPTLPWVLAQEYKEQYDLSDADTRILVSEKETASYFLKLCKTISTR